MAKIFLDTHNGSDEFSINEFIHIAYDSAAQKFIACIKDEPPKILPVTKGNLAFYIRMAPYFQGSLTSS